MSHERKNQVASGLKNFQELAELTNKLYSGRTDK